ncbi:2TM domain-containing protein [Gimesia fumaroli]|uniref:2TM domain-containing protein n=1 Tax=Gimesia fumaroli TaxID=2527976 RepID=A0A518IIH7_9PLAN|nr:2TM domain-containing protein [Gimesia fumaroli]QDV52840.1 hypothetical protein Enr17x_49090 [Gimesia fumaroli]
MANKDKNYEQAKSRVEKKIGFMIHVGVYVVVNAGLITLNLTRSPEKYWFIWPLGGWGIGLAFHAFKAFSSGSAVNWKEKMIKKEQEKLDQ